MTKRGTSGWETRTDSVEETLALGERLGHCLRPGAVVGLVGTLGSGKTHFVKGVARGDAMPEGVSVTSPTFVIINEYPGRLYIHHIDAYRLHGSEDLEALGIDEMVTGGGAVVIEWADRVESCLPADRLMVEIDIVGETGRQFRFAAGGATSHDVLAGLRTE